jgi:hypothetical protein
MAHTIVGAGAAQFADRNSHQHHHSNSIGGHGHAGEPTVMVIDGEAVRIRAPTISDLHLHDPVVPPSVAPVWGGGPPSFLRIESLGGISGGALSPRTEADFMLSPKSPRRNSLGDDDTKRLTPGGHERRSSFVDTTPTRPSTITEEDTISPNSIGISVTDASGHRRTYTSPGAGTEKTSSTSTLPTIADSVAATSPSSRRLSNMSVTSVDRPSLVSIDDTPTTATSTSTSASPTASTSSSELHPTGRMPLLSETASSGTTPTSSDAKGTITSSTSYERLNAHLHPHVRAMIGDTDSAPATPAQRGVSWVVPMSTGDTSAGAGGRRRPKKLGALGRSPSDIKLEEDEDDDTISPLLKVRHIGNVARG